MVRRIVAVALFLSVFPFGVYAAETDNAAPMIEDTDSTPFAVTSYFQGVWVGSWPGFSDASKSQDITIKTGKEIKDKTFMVIYSWDAVEWK